MPSLRYWAYDTIARGASAYLSQDRRVASVHVTGSLVTGKRLSPGRSDIDLTLVADVPTLEDELAFRATLVRRHARLPKPLFYNLDYILREDVRYLRAFGDRWARSPWRVLRGVPVPQTRTSPAEARILWVLDCLKAWHKAVPEIVTARVWDGGAAGRLLARILSGLLQLSDREVDLKSLARRACAAHDLPEVRGVGHGRAGSFAYLVAAYAALDRLCALATEGWPASWRVEQRGKPTDASFGKGLLAPGLPTVVLVQRGPRMDDVLPIVLVRGEPGEALRSVASVMVKSHAATLPLPNRPLFVSPSMWRALAFVRPLERVGPAAASGFARILGKDPADAPRAPPPEVLRMFADLAVAHAFYAPRSRALRRGRTRGRGEYELVRAVTALDDLALYQDEGIARVIGAYPVPEWSEREALERLREWSIVRRAKLESRSEMA